MYVYISNGNRGGAAVDRGKERETRGVNSPRVKGKERNRNLAAEISFHLAVSSNHSFIAAVTCIS